jgi:hypothetical protein
MTRSRLLGSGHLLHGGDGAVDLEGLCQSHSASRPDIIARETVRVCASQFEQEIEIEVMSR